MTRLQKNSEEIKKKLRLLRDIMRRETVTEDIPRPSLCLRTISQDIQISVMEAGLHEYALGEIGTFIFWYDVEEGIAHTNGGISMALEAEKETTYQMINTLSRERRYVIIRRTKPKTEGVSHANHVSESDPGE